MPLRARETTKLSNKPDAGPQSTNLNGVDLPSNDDTVDPFILDFGTSVNVNEDLRRALRAEVQEIDESIVAIASSNKQEDTIERQLRQDLSHSGSELHDLARSTADQLESVNIHGSVLNSLENSIKTQLLLPTVPPVVSVPVENKENESQNRTTAREPSRKTSSSHGTNKTVTQEYAAKLKALTTKLNEMANEVDTLLASQKDIVDATAKVQQRIENEDLHSVLQHRTEAADRKAKEIEKENQRLTSLRMSTQKCRGQGGNNAQKLADITKELNKFESEAEREIQSLKDQEVSLSERVTEKEAALIKKKAELETASAELKQLELLENFRKESQGIKIRMDEEVTEHTELVRKQAELKLRATESEERLAESLAEEKKAEKLMADATLLKQKNDDEHNMVVVPGRVELSDIAEKKERLAVEIADTQAQGQESVIREKDIVDELTSRNGKLQEEERALQEELKGLRVKEEHILRTRQESRESWQREIDLQLDVEKKLHNALEAKKAHCSDMQKSRAALADATIRKAQEEADDQQARGERLHQVLTAGAAIMEKSQAKVREMQGSIESQA